MEGLGMADLGTMFGAGKVTTFMGLPEDDGRVAAPAVILGAGACTSYPSVGAYCAGGPQAIRAGGAQYAASLAHVNFDSGQRVFPEGCLPVDAGDLSQVDGAGAENRARIRQAVEGVLKRNAVPVLIGGDDSIPLPMLQAFEGRPITILQIDAHIDWREEVEGERMGLSSTMRRASELPHVQGIVQVAQRGIGSARPGDLADARKAGVTFLPAREMAREGFARALAAIPEGGDVVICLDCDALDPAIMPAVIGRAAGGPGYWEVLELIEAVAARARIAAFDIVEFMPERDIDGQGALVAAQLLAAVLGIVARQSQSLYQGAN